MNLPNELIEKIVIYLSWEKYLCILYKKIFDDTDDGLEAIWEYAIENDLLHLVQYLTENKTYYNMLTCPVRMAARSGNVHIFEYIYNNIYTGVNFDLECAVETNNDNNLKMVQWICENVKDVNYGDSIYYAMENNMLDVVKYLHELKIYKEYDNYNLNRAIYSENVELVKFVYENMYHGSPKGMIYESLEVGNKDVLEYLLKLCDKYPKKILNYAAKYNNLEIVKYLHKDYKCKDKLSKHDLDHAVKHNHLDIIDFIIKNYPEICENFSFESEIKICFNNPQEYLNIIKFMKQNNYKYIPYTK
jgi:hypothetical protein